MEKIETLNELRGVLSGLLVKAQGFKRGESYKDGDGKWQSLPWGESCVLTCNAELGTSLAVNWRRLKPENSIEVCRISAVDREDGPTSKRFNFYLVRLAAFLCRRELYPQRETIDSVSKQVDMF